MHIKSSPLPMFDLDADGHVQLRWTRPEGALHGLMTLDEALDLQFELATFLAQVESRAYQEHSTATACECEVPASMSELAKAHKFLN